MSEGYTYSYRKWQVLMKNLFGNTQGKPYELGVASPPPFVRPRVSSIQFFIFIAIYILYV